MDWDDFSRPWLEAAPSLEIAHRPVLDVLVEAAKMRIGERILDVGCGTGPSVLRAAEAVGSDGRVVGIDIAPPLIKRASERVSNNVDLIVGDAGSHAFLDGTEFDLVLSNFGMMFFDDTTAACENLRCYVPEGGRLAASVWGLPTNNPWFATPRRILDELIADVPRPDPKGPGPMRFADPTSFTYALEISGWLANVETHELFLTPPGTPKDVASLHMMVTAGMLLQGMDVSRDLIEMVRDRIVQANHELQVDGRVRVPAEIHIVTATAV